MMRKTRIALHTLGCKANQADSTYLEGLLRQKGYEVVGLNDIAEYYILNTCTVTHVADREARQLTRRAKRRNPEAKVIVTGCYAQTQAEALAALESVDCVVGNAEKESIPNMLPTVGAHLCVRPINGQTHGSAPTKNVSSIRQQNTVPSFGLSHYSKNSRAQVKIQDGCDKFCSYCIVPYARGKNRSVDPEDILQELHQLRQHGFEEAILTGIHIGSYGHDKGLNLEFLLEQIEREKPLPRIRLSSLDPEEVTDRLINIVAASDVICSHFHVALQSGDNVILDRMKRHYDAKRFYQVIDKIITAMPHASIGTDVIVGFPGETNEQFVNTYRMIEKLPIAYVHVFPYSKRKGTAAAQYEDHLNSAVKKERAQRLRALAQKKKQDYYQSFAGRSLEVIVEAANSPKEGLLRGISTNYIPVYFEGSTRDFHKRINVVIDKIIGTRAYGHVA